MDFFLKKARYILKSNSFKFLTNFMQKKKKPKSKLSNTVQGQI